MKYTKEIPTVPGYYWVRERETKDHRKIAEVYPSSPNGKLRLRFDGLTMFPDDFFEYSDQPIPEPEE